MGRDKEVSLRCYLKSGTYTIYVLIEWFDNQPHQFGMGCYFPQGRDVKFRRFTPEDDRFLLGTLISNAATGGRKVSYPQQRKTYRVQNLDAKAGWLYYYYNNVRGRKTLVESC